MRNPKWLWVIAGGMLWACAAPVGADSYTQSVPVLVIVEPLSATHLDVPEPVEMEALLDPLAPPDGALITTSSDGGAITILYTKTE